MALVDGVVLASRVEAASGRAYWIADARPYPVREIVATVEDALRAEGFAVKGGSPNVPNLIGDVAERLDIPVTRVSQLIRDGHLVAVQVEAGRRIPASMIMDGAVVKSLPSVITQLRDVRYTDEEIVDWLHRDDDSLPGSPIEALRANRGSEVKRRAQVAGF